MTSLGFLIKTPKRSIMSFFADWLELEQFPALWILIIFQSATAKNCSSPDLMESHLVDTKLRWIPIQISGAFSPHVPSALISCPANLSGPNLPDLQSLTLQFSEPTVLSSDFPNLHHGLENASRTKAGGTTRFTLFVSFFLRGQNPKMAYCKISENSDYRFFPPLF